LKGEAEKKAQLMNPVRPIWFYTYILRSEKMGTLYTGVTNNLAKRLEQHNMGDVYYTKHKRPYTLIYYEACISKYDAYRRERYLKTGMGKGYIKNRLKGGLTG
jgi:putative endonuclease